MSLMTVAGLSSCAFMYEEFLETSKPSTHYEGSVLHSYHATEDT